LRSVGINNGAIVWRYRWAGNQMLSEYDDTDGTWEIEDSKLIYTYVHDPAMVAGAPLADLAGTNPSSGTARYYFGDHIGSTRRLRNASKTSLGQYEYQPYGEMYAESGATPKYKFAGMYYAPDLAHYYTLNRYYNPTLARWTTRDPLGMVDGPNVYAYVRAIPTNRVDRKGTTVDVLLITRMNNQTKCCKTYSKQANWELEGYSSAEDCIESKMAEVNSGWTFFIELCSAVGFCWYTPVGLGIGSGLGAQYVMFSVYCNAHKCLEYE